ncbi:MAG: 2Fe-2S iron-sulfur cluster-binding protein [Cyanobacteria bacterium P01_A01_bin.37]
MALDGISQLKNPLLRALLSAWVGLTAGVMISGAVVGFKVEKDDAQFKSVGYVALVAAALGGIYGFIHNDQRPASVSKIPQSTEWTDWHPFVVVRTVQESSEITSFYLRPQDGIPLPEFKPGQFLTIKLDIPDQGRPVIRTYSLSDYAVSNDHYRLSIKRERSPKDKDVPPGVASNFMHDHVHEGTVILAKPPNGKFFLNLTQNHPVVLISNGVGITPMVSMAKASLQNQPNRHVWFLHGARNGEFHAFRDEMGAIAQAFPNLHVYYRYSRPRSEDEGGYHSTGYVDIDMLKTIVAPEIDKVGGSLAEAEYFLCGSSNFMDSLRSGLSAWGVPDARVSFEAFSKPKADSKARESTYIDDDQRNAITQAEVTFSKSGKTAIWTGEQGTLLEFAEAQGLDPAYSCRAGICLTCMCSIEDGDVQYEEPPTGNPDAGTALICVAKPKTERVVLDL